MDYLHRFNLITQPWSREISLSGVSQKDVVAEGGEGMTQSVRKMCPLLLLTLKREEGGHKPRSVGGF